MVQVTPQVFFRFLLLLQILHLYEQLYLGELCAVVGGVGGQGCGLQQAGLLPHGNPNASSDCAHRCT